MSVTPAPIVANFFGNVVKQLLQVDTDTEDGQQFRHDMMDLALAMIPSMPAESIALLYRVIKPQLQVSQCELASLWF